MFSSAACICTCHRLSRIGFLRTALVAISAHQPCSLDAQAPWSWRELAQWPTRQRPYRTCVQRPPAVLSPVRCNQRELRHLSRSTLAGKAASVNIATLRLAPEHKFPANKIEFSGESAGGATVAAKSKGLPLPAVGLSISPWANLEHTGACNPTASAFANRGLHSE